MTPEPGESGELPPSTQVTVVAEAVLLRAKLVELREEAQGTYDFLDKLRKPTLEDLENADDLQAKSIGIYTTSRFEIVSDLELLDDALHLTDRAIELLEAEASALTLWVSFSLGKLRHRMGTLTDLEELEEPLAELREAVQHHPDHGPG